MAREFIFNMRDLVVVKDKNKDIFYAIENKTWSSSFSEVAASINNPNRQDLIIANPEMEATLIIENDEQKFDLGTSKRVVRFNDVEGVLIQFI